MSTDIQDGTAHTIISYRPDIDGLRALAVLLVVGFHALPGRITGGYIGVDIFFVISGYLISSIILRNLDNGTFTFSGFYARRIRRIFPSLIVVLITCLAIGFIGLFSYEYKQLGKHIAGGAGFVSNFVLWCESGYFDDTAESKPLLHLWSLGIEEQFYIAWPFLIWAIWKLRLNTLTFMIILGGISFALNINYSHRDVVYDFFSPQTRFWELMAGSALAGLHSTCSLKLSWFASKLDSWLGKMIYAQAPENDGSTLRNVQSFIGLSFISISAYLLNKNEAHFPGYWALLPVLGALFIINAGSLAWFNRHVLSCRIFVNIGLISFPLYLWHWPLLSFARIAYGDFPPILVRGFLIVLSFALAVLTYYGVEKPIRSGANARIKTTTLIIVMMITGSAGYFIYKTDGVSYFNRPYVKISLAVGEWQFPGEKLTSFYFNDRLFYKQNSAKLTNTLFVGDSNVEQYYVRTDQLIQQAPDMNNGVLFGTGGNCLPIPGVYQKGFEWCDTLMPSSLKLALSRPDITNVVLAGAWYTYFARPGYNVSANGTDLSVQQGASGYPLALESLGNWIKTLRAANKTVYIILGIPSGDEVGPKMMLRRTVSGFPNMLSVGGTGGLAYSLFNHRAGAIRNDLAALAREAGAHVIDPVLSLCDNIICRALDENGVPLYMDNLHLRPSFVRTHANFIDITLQNDMHN